MQQETTYGAAEIELDEERNYGRANSKPFGRTTLPHGVALIGGFGSYALVVNNISGPGMLDFPQAFQAAGWLPCVLCILGVAAVSAAVACASDRCPRFLEKGKGHARHEPDVANEGGPVARAVLEGVQSDSVEFSEMFGAAYGGAIFRGTQLLYFLNLFSQNVAAIVTTAQATDSMIAALFGDSYALNVPHFTIETWEGCKREGCVPFRLASPGLLLTAGYAFCFLTLGPLGFFTLQENMLAQKISFVLLVALTLQFLAYFVTSPDPHRVSVRRAAALGRCWCGHLQLCLLRHRTGVAQRESTASKREEDDLGGVLVVGGRVLFGRLVGRRRHLAGVGQRVR